MSIEIKVPVLPESVSDAGVAVWHKKPGDSVERDEVLVELETDKVMLEIPAPAAGVLESIAHDEGAVVTSDTVLGILSEGAAAKPSAAEASAPAAEASAPASEPESTESADALSPTVRKLLHEHDLDPTHITGTGKGGRITKQDILSVIKSGGAVKPAENKSESAAVTTPAASAPAETNAEAVATPAVGRTDERVKMTRLRQRIAERLVSVGQETAMLTTFNEVDMHAVINLRQEFKDKFEKTHGVRLGFMSFFIKAAVEALKQFPAVNASIDGDEIVYHNYFDVGIAVGGGKGLVVPILRDVETMGMADIEKQVRAYGAKAKEGKITLEDMTGGTFTITNGGVYGSMLSTPIINPPQSAILGMHNIVERPVVVDGEIVVRPIMYLALSYDHRIVDGKEAVSFLVALKQFIEEPTRMLLAV